MVAPALALVLCAGTLWTWACERSPEVKPCVWAALRPPVVKLW